MTTSAKTLREAIAASLSGLDMQVSAYVLAQPKPPCLYVVDGEIVYDEAFARGYDTWLFTVYAVVAFATDMGAALQLDELRAPYGPSSVKELIETRDEDGQVLAGAAFEAVVESASATRIYVREGQTSPLLGCEFSVRVRASGKE